MAVYAIVCNDSLWYQRRLQHAAPILSSHHQFLLWNIMIITGFRSAFIMISMWTSGLVSPPVICNIAALIPAFCANFLCVCAGRQGKMTLFKLQFFFSFCLDHCSFCMHPCLYNHICEHILLFTDHFQPCSFLVNANQTLLLLILHSMSCPLVDQQDATVVKKLLVNREGISELAELH